MPENERDISVFKIVALYIGAVIGAGFASGQELMRFFAVYGSKGLWAAGLATGLLIYLGAAVLFLSVKYRTANYLQLINRLTGPWQAKVFDWLSMAMLLAGLGVMLSGSGAVFSEYLGIAAWPGVLLLLGLVVLVLSGGMAGVIRINFILVPLKIAVILLISWLVLLFCHPGSGPAGEIPGTAGISTGNWYLSGILYVSYNMILVLAVLSTLGNRVSAGKGLVGGALGGLGLGLAAGMVVLAQGKLYPAIASYQVPLLFMAGQVSPVLRIPVALLIWLAILTTAVANAHGLAARFAPVGSTKYKLAGGICALLVLPLGGQDFDRLVGAIYPLFGYAGLALLLLLFIHSLGPLIKFWGAKFGGPKSLIVKILRLLMLWIKKIKS
ncbi:MAG: hypothetical protein FWC60_05925 [Firmicutes bacterium]|nr:hypothetical protein [Bacillota bacterium]